VNGLKKGDKYAISIDCTKVLNDITPRDAISNSGTESEHCVSDYGELLLTKDLSYRPDFSFRE